jgi:hypothetical protein
MSEKKPLIIPALLKPPKYDFDFIAQAFGLLPIGIAAINQSALIAIEPTEEGAQFILLGDENIYDLTHEQLAELEASIRAQIAEAKRMQGAPPGGGLIIPQLVPKGQ